MPDCKRCIKSITQGDEPCGYWKEISNMIKMMKIPPAGRGLLEITREVQSQVTQTCPGDGLCTLAIQHTSASLLVQENADPSARVDLENWLDRLVPENDPLYTHTMEGPDDMPAHIKAMLTQTTLSIPLVSGRLALGTWQGIYLWEHRDPPQSRRVVLHIMCD